MIHLSAETTSFSVYYLVPIVWSGIFAKQTMERNPIPRIRDVFRKVIVYSAMVSLGSSLAICLLHRVNPRDDLPSILDYGVCSVLGSVLGSGIGIVASAGTIKKRLF